MVARALVLANERLADSALAAGAAEGVALDDVPGLVLALRKERDELRARLARLEVN